MKRLLLILFLFFSCESFSQVNLDSLWKVWNDTHQQDTVRMNAIKRICINGYLFTKPDSAFYFSHFLYDLAVKTKSKNYQVSALNIQGASSSIQGENTKAIEYFTRSLKISEELGDKHDISNCLNNIGVIYNEQSNYPKALEYFTKALKIIEEMGNKNAMILSYGNIGNIYRNLKDFPKAIDYQNKSLKLSEENNDQAGIGNALHSLGVIYFDRGENDKGLDYNLKSIKYYEETDDQHGMVEVLNIIGNIYDKKGDNAKAIEYNKRALDISQKLGFAASMREASNSLYESYKKTGNYKDALKMYELYFVMRDSIKNEETQKEIIKQELQYTYEKQKAVDEKEHEKQMAVSSEQEQKQKVISYAIAAGLLLVLIFALFVFNRLRITRKQKMEIGHQKELVEEKQKEILDSITYAKRLQDAILPSEQFMKEQLPESFILYKPKDIVAGDFYWMEVKNSAKEKLVLIAAADCTGHGVPGAMVSVVCSNALNRAVLEFGITEPGKILDKTRELVLHTFSKSDSDVKDGMDISLASININTQEIKWAGANNPLWYISGNEVKEIKADKQAIGKTEKPNPFTTHSIQLQKGDSLFLFTDGYADQFGGEKGKKFKYKPLKELLLKNSNLSQNEQKENLETAFNNWKVWTDSKDNGGLEQVDDICIIGIKL